MKRLWSFLWHREVIVGLVVVSIVLVGIWCGRGRRLDSVATSASTESSSANSRPPLARHPPLALMSTAGSPGTIVPVPPQDAGPVELQSNSGVMTWSDAGLPVPIFPVNWTVPNWYIDPSNSIGCASDTNSGVSATCTGGCSGSACPSGNGPLLTFQELNVHRWGCLGNPSHCPRLQQKTVITVLSNEPTSDPMGLYPDLEDNASINVTAPLGAAQTVCSGNLSSVSNNVVASNALTAATLPCVAGINSLVLDSTNPSGFWTYVSGGGSAYSLSQPLSSAQAGYTPGTALAVGTEVTIGADAVIVYSPVTVNLVAFSPTNVGSSSAAISSISDITIAGGTIYRDSAIIGGAGQGIVIVNVVSTKRLNITRAWTQAGQAWLNVDYQGGIIGTNPYNSQILGSPGHQAVFLIGGIVGAANALFQLDLAATIFDGNIIFGGPVSRAFTLSEPQISQLFVDATEQVTTRGVAVANVNSLYAAGVQIWGTGAIDATGKFLYPAGASGATNAFGVGGVTMQENLQNAGCVGNPLSFVMACDAAVTAANLDVVLGTTIPNGCVYQPGGGGAFCNGGY